MLLPVKSAQNSALNSGGTKNIYIYGNIKKLAKKHLIKKFALLGIKLLMSC